MAREPKIIDVPEVTQLPELPPNEFAPVEFANMALTALFQHEHALLHAEYRPPEPGVIWYVRPLRSETEPQDSMIVMSESSSIFRMVLARFGHCYMNGQLYGGFAMPCLRQNGKIYSCRIFMSNMGQSGFWIRVYAGLKEETSFQHQQS